MSSPLTYLKDLIDGLRYGSTWDSSTGIETINRPKPNPTSQYRPAPPQPTPQQQYSQPVTQSVQTPVQPVTQPVTPLVAKGEAYKALIAKYFPDDPNRIYQVAGGESSYNPRLIHSNSNVFSPQDGVQIIKSDPQAAIVPENFTRQQWAVLRAKHPNLDIGLLQINTDPKNAMANYLIHNNLTFYDLLDPEKNVKVASDLYHGKIPQTAPGIGNWIAAKGLGFTQ